MSISLPPASPLNVAYAGTADGAKLLMPAVQLLQEERPGARLSLLWPPDVPFVPPLGIPSRRRIRYPARHADSRSLRRAIDALRDEHSECALIFTEAGWSADVPAYIAYLAGIRLRSGIEGEFGGGLLSHTVVEPPAWERDRHLYLLRAHGLVRRRMLSGSATATPQGDNACAP